jgi:ATP-dependent DNA helicase PIF1
MAKKKFYAVRKGRRMGIFPSWEACKVHVDHYPRAEFKGFATLAEAQTFLGEMYYTNSQQTSVAVTPSSPTTIGHMDVGTDEDEDEDDRGTRVNYPIVDDTPPAADDDRKEAAVPCEASHNSNDAASEGEKIKELNEKQRQALELARQGKNIFITGPAGTGKSLALQEIISLMKQKYNYASDEWVALGSTGTSALAVSGQSLHSFAGCGVPVTVKDFKKAWRGDKRAAWRAARSMIIDEISMVNGELLDNLSDVVCDIRGDFSKPFGGIQLIVCGDFLQLPPIPKRKHDILLMLNAGKTPEDLHCDRGFAFQSKVWHDANFENVILDEVFRQKNRRFINVLHEIRQGRISDEADSFLARCNRPLPPRNGIKPTILYAKNVNVSKENDQELAMLPGEEHLYKAVDRVEVFNDGFKVADGTAESILWKNQFFDNCSAEENIFLKKGAQVMLIRNFDIKGGLVNGSRGKIVDFTDVLPEDGITESWAPYELPGYKGTMKYPVVEFIDSKNTQNVVQKVVGPLNFTSRLAGIGECIRSQIPLKLAWAITVHKSQGMTLNYVKADLQGVFTEAQAYVALSRASDENGLELRNFQRSMVRADQRALDFYANPGAKFRLWSEVQTGDNSQVQSGDNNSSFVFPKPIPGCLVGLLFVFTGELKNCTRDDAEELVRSCGGEIRSSVSGKTNVLVTGEVLNDGRDVRNSTKFGKAKAVMAGPNNSNLKIVNEKDLFALIKKNKNEKRSGGSISSFFPTQKKQATSGSRFAPINIA